MGVITFNNRKKREKTAKGEREAKETFLAQAAQAATIVSQSVEDGEISKVSDKLNEYVGTISTKNQYVFERAPYTSWLLLLVIGIISSLGFLFFIPIAAGTLVYSEDFRQYGLWGLIIVVLAIAINFFICIKAVQEIRFSRRYDHYRNVLKYRNIEFVDDLAGMLDVQRKITEKDLKKAVRIKLIPQGHFGKDNLFFMVSDDVFAKYSRNKAAYDRYFRQLLEDRARMRERTKETEELLAQGEEYLQKIHDSNDIIKDSDVSMKLERMENVVAAIFHEVDINPSQANKLGLFINYYLPTTERLLESYIEIDEKLVKGAGLQKAQKEITEALDSINDAFECLLERFYEEQELDISSDIYAMARIMKQEGL